MREIIGLILNLFSSNVYVIYRDANCTRIVHEVVLVYVYLIANRHFEFPTMPSIFLFIITTLRFLITVIYLVYEN